MSRRSGRMVERPAALGIRARSALRFLAGRPPTERWPAHRVVDELAMGPAAGWLALQQLVGGGLVQLHPSDDGVIRLTVSPAGRRRLRGSARRDLGG